MTYTQPPTETNDEAPNSSADDGGRPVAITWLAATGTALLFASLAIFTVTQWQEFNDLTKFAILIAATVVAMTSGIRMQRRLPVTGLALAHLGALLIPIDATALANSFNWSWPQLIILQGVTGFGAIVALQRRASSIVLDYARPVAVLMATAGIAELTHSSAPTLAALIGLALVAFASESRSVYTVVGAAAFAPIAATLIDGTFRHSHYLVGQGVAERLGVVGAAPSWYLVTAVCTAVAFMQLAQRSQRLALGGVAAGAFVLNAALAWTALPHGESFGSSMRPLALCAMFEALQLLAVGFRNDPLFSSPTNYVAKASEYLAAIPTMVVTVFAITTVHLDVDGPSAFGIAVIATGWIISLGRSRRSRNETAFDVEMYPRIVIAAGGLLSTIVALAPTRLWVATIVATVAISTVLVQRRREIDVAALTGLTWSIFAASTTGWLPAFAALAIVVAVATALHRKTPEILWFATIAAVLFETLGLIELDVQANMASLALSTVAAAILVIAAVTAREWRAPLYALASVSALVGMSTASVAAQHEIGNVLLIIGAGVLAFATLRRHATAANVGGACLVYGTWANLAFHDVTAIEWFMIPLGLHLAIAGELYRRAAMRSAATAPISSWAAHGPALVALIVPALLAGLQHGAHFHLLFAGAVAVVAVAIGGIHRMAAPLLLGTASLTIITADMAVGPASQVESWVWLALGGSALVATAIGMERTHTSPVAAGRRLIEVVNEQFV